MREITRKLGRTLLVFDKFLVVVVFLLLGLYRPDHILLITFALGLVYLFVTKRYVLIRQTLVAVGVSGVWLAFARNQYDYNREFATIYGLNTFPFFAWILGLMAVYLIYSHYEYRLKTKKFVSKLALFSLIYWPLLLASEKIGYDIFNIKNLAAADYNPLIICNCLHAAPWMQLSYLLMGPIFLGICYWFKLENPHQPAKEE